MGRIHWIGQSHKKFAFSGITHNPEKAWVKITIFGVNFR
jgi:hypothetical protein